MAGRPAGNIWMRPEHAAVGRPAQRSRDEITAAALAIADRDGLDAVSMRRVAADLGTAAGSLYRYLDNRDDLLDLMIDATGGEYAFPQPTGNWLADLVTIGEQARAIMRRHPWLPGLIISHAVLGPNGLVLLEHFLGILADHPAAVEAKMEAFAMFNGITALWTQTELADGAAGHQRNAAYLQYALAAGEHPRLAQLLGLPAPSPADSPPVPGAARAAPSAAAQGNRYAEILTRILSGLLAPV
jgi:AcrR family transcriptional regulator